MREVRAGVLARSLRGRDIRCRLDCNFPWEAEVRTRYQAAVNEMLRGNVGGEMYSD